MRTIVSFDDDLVRQLDKERRRFGASFSEVVNHFLRLGLMAAKGSTRKPFVVTPRKLGMPPGLTYDKVDPLLDSVEGSGKPWDKRNVP